MNNNTEQNDRRISRREIATTVAAGGLGLAALGVGAVPVAAASGRPQNIVVHLSNSEGENSMHAAMMGIGLATALRKMGAEVTLMLDASAPNFAKRDWSDKSLSATSPMAAKMPPMRLGDTLAGFVKAGGVIRLCPHCSVLCGVTPGDVVPGAQLAAEGELAKIVFAADKILDY